MGKVKTSFLHVLYSRHKIACRQVRDIFCDLHDATPHMFSILTKVKAFGMALHHLKAVLRLMPIHNLVHERALI